MGHLDARQGNGLESQNVDRGGNRLTGIEVHGRRGAILQGQLENGRPLQDSEPGSERDAPESGGLIPTDRKTGGQPVDSRSGRAVERFAVGKALGETSRDGPEGRQHGGIDAGRSQGAESRRIDTQIRIGRHVPVRRLHAIRERWGFGRRLQLPASKA